MGGERGRGVVGLVLTGQRRRRDGGGWRWQSETLGRGVGTWPGRSVWIWTTRMHDGRGWTSGSSGRTRGTGAVGLSVSSTCGTTRRPTPVSVPVSPSPVLRVLGETVCRFGVSVKVRLSRARGVVEGRLDPWLRVQEETLSSGVEGWEDTVERGADRYGTL